MMSNVINSSGGGGQFATSPMSLDKHRLWNAAKRASTRIISSEAGLRCAGVAFYGFLSLFPAIAAAVILFGLFLDRSIIDTVVTTISPLIPQGPEDILRAQLTKLESAEGTDLGWGLILTFALALWSGSRGTNAMVYAVTRAYREDGERGFVKGILISFGLTIIAFIMAVVTLFTVAIIPALIQLLPLPRTIETYANWLRWPVVACLVLLSTILFYRIAPFRRSPQFRWIIPGAILASSLWLVASYGFSFYVENFGSYDATFGSLAAVVVLLLWLYYSSVIFILGAMFNAELELETGHDTTKGSPRPAGKRNAYVADNISDEV